MMTKKKNNGGGNRISIVDLPDDCLLHIFSFLDTKTTIQSSLLVSKRWKDLWTSAPSLSLTNPFVSSSKRQSSLLVPKRWNDLWTSAPSLPLTNPFVSSSKRSQDFMNFVDKVLELRCDDVNIQNFHINSYYYCHPDRLASWISYAAMHGVEDLQFCVNSDNKEINFKEYAKLPECLITCQTIKVLQLISGMQRLLLPSLSSFSLPQLQVLHLKGVVCQDGNLVSAALADCPHLDTLVLRNYVPTPYNLHISSPKLKKLAVTAYHSYLNIRIYAPNLTWLELDFVAQISQGQEWPELDSVAQIPQGEQEEDWLSKALVSSPLLQTLVIKRVDRRFGDDWITVALATCLLLQTLVIRRCYLPDTFRELHISSQYLKKLELNRLECWDGGSLNISISAPNLTSLTLIDSGYIIGNSCSLCNMKSLEKAEMRIYIPRNDPLKIEDVNKVMKTLHSLNNVKDLSILEPPSVLAIRNWLKFSNLRSLKLHVWFYMACILPLAHLLKSSPHLETLIMVREGVGVRNPEWKIHDHKSEGKFISKDKFNHVKILKMENFKAVEDELEFLQLVLRSAPVLEKVIFTIADWSGGNLKERLKKAELAKLPRASRNVLVSFIHPRTSFEYVL